MFRLNPQTETNFIIKTAVIIKARLLHYKKYKHDIPPCSPLRITNKPIERKIMQVISRVSLCHQNALQVM